MKYLKKFELIDYDESPEKGNYVLCEEDNIIINKLIKDKIGIIIRVDHTVDNPYLVKFLEIIDSFNIKNPYLFNNNCRWFKKHEILHFSNDREELSALISAKKYNL